MLNQECFLFQTMISSQLIVMTLDLWMLLLVPVCQAYLVCLWHSFQVLAGFETNRKVCERKRTKRVVH